MYKFRVDKYCKPLLIGPLYMLIYIIETQPKTTPKKNLIFYLAASRIFPNTLKVYK